MEKIVGVINLPGGVLTSHEVLGESFKISIKEWNGRIYFPKLPDEFSETGEWDRVIYNLYPPEGWFEKNLSDRKWGMVYRSDGLSYVNCIGILLEQNANDSHERDEIINSYKNDIDNWRHLFISLIEATTKQTLSEDSIYDNSKFKLYYQKTVESKIQPFTNNIIITVPDFTKLDNFVLNKYKVEDVIRLSIISEELAIEHKLLNEARSSFTYREYRKTIIDASAVIEIVLSKQIDKELDRFEMKFKNRLKKKFKMLGGKFELVEIIGIELPKFNINDVLEPRNKVAHAGFFPSAKEAKNILDIAETLTDRFSPSLI